MLTARSPGASTATGPLSATTPLLPTLLPTASIIVRANASQTEAVYVRFNSEAFSAGIKREIGYMKDHFPAAHITTCDVKIMAINYLTIRDPYANNGFMSFALNISITNQEVIELVSYNSVLAWMSDSDICICSR